MNFRHGFTYKNVDDCYEAHEDEDSVHDVPFTSPDARLVEVLFVNVHIPRMEVRVVLLVDATLV